MERMWYYAPGGSDRQGPVSETQMQDLLKRGQLAPADLVWTEGMATWVAAGQVPELQAVVAPGTAPDTAPSAPAPAPAGVLIPAGLGSWLTFVGIINILGGGLTCLSCVGLPMGVLMILAGVACLNSRTALQELVRVDAALLPALEKLKSYFVMTGWVYILHVIMFCLLLLFYAGLFVTMFSTFSKHMP
jgi:hypothetical protein